MMNPKLIKPYTKQEIPKIPRNIIEKQRKRKILTYIQGARYKSGVVLVADRKISRGSDVVFENKLFSIPIGRNEKVIAGFSGATSLLDKFNRFFNSMLKKKRPKDLESLLDLIGDIVWKIYLTKRYKYNESDLIEGLLCVRNKDTGKMELHHIDMTGEIEKVSWYVIGSGEPLGRLFNKSYYSTLNENIRSNYGTILTGCLVIRMIEQLQLDMSVGGKPQVWIISDEKSDKQLKTKEIRKFLDKADEQVQRIAEFIGYSERLVRKGVFV